MGVLNRHRLQQQLCVVTVRSEKSSTVEAERCAALLGRCSLEGCAAEARVEFAAVHALIYSSLVTKPPNLIEVGSSRMALLMAREQTCEEASAICGWGSLLPDALATPSSGGSIPMFGAGTSSLIRGIGACGACGAQFQFHQHLCKRSP